MTKTDPTKRLHCVATQNGNTLTIHKPGATETELTDQLSNAIKKATKDITGQSAKRWIIKIEK